MAVAGLFRVWEAWMHWKDVSHVGLSLCSLMCHSLNNNGVLHLALHLTRAPTPLQPFFCQARKNGPAWGRGTGQARGNSSSNAPEFVLRGKPTPGTTPVYLELELYNSARGESYSALKVPFLCEASVALKGTIIPRKLHWGISPRRQLLTACQPRLLPNQILQL